jgi:hypothetical protein
MAVVTRDSTQGWQSKGLYGGTTEETDIFPGQTGACLLWKMVSGSTYTG